MMINAFVMAIIFCIINTLGCEVASHFQGFVSYLIRTIALVAAMRFVRMCHIPLTLSNVMLGIAGVVVAFVAEYLIMMAISYIKERRKI